MLTALAVSSYIQWLMSVSLSQHGQLIALKHQRFLSSTRLPANCLSMGTCGVRHAKETDTFAKWMIRGKVNESGKMKERRDCGEKEKYSRRQRRGEWCKIGREVSKRTPEKRRDYGMLSGDKHQPLSPTQLSTVGFTLKAIFFCLFAWRSA